MAEDEKSGPRVPPPRGGARRGLTAAPPASGVTPDNMQKANSGTQDLNFKVDPTFHFAFKMAATGRRMPMKDLLETAFRLWLDTYGTDQERNLLPPKSNPGEGER